MLADGATAASKAEHDHVLALAGKLRAETRTRAACR
jgi:hypothetical protein